MTPQFAIKKFKEQISNLSTTDFKLWLDTTYTYVEEYFSITSNQSLNFKSLIGDVNIYYAGFPFLQDSKKENAFKDRAIGYLNSYITYIEEKEKESAQIQKEIISNILLDRANKEVINKTSDTNGKSVEQSKKTNPQNTQSKMKPFFSISIILTLLAGAFFLGLYIGQAKFDKEKIELYEENKSFKKDIETLKIQVDSLNKQNSNLILKYSDLENKYKTLLIYSSKD